MKALCSLWRSFIVSLFSSLLSTWCFLEIRNENKLINYTYVLNCSLFDDIVIYWYDTYTYLN